MPRVGTATVAIEPDLSAFGASLSAKIKAALAGEPDPQVNVDVDVDKQRARGLGARILAALGHQTVKVDVDVDRSQLSELKNVIGNAFRGVAAGVGGLLGNLPGIGGLFRGLQSSFGTSAIGASAATAAILGLATALAALTASLGAAVAGLGALAVALGAALGPAILVTVGAFIRFAQIVKAVKDHESNASAEARGLAGAQQQVQAATDALASAQDNLKEQTTAAYQAWADAIENVRDDLLGVQDAKLGISDAALSTREAKQALVDFRKEAGASGKAFGDVFKKFTDVHVDTSGLKAALSAAAAASGSSLSGDQELKLERLILNVRRAKLGEKHATDALHDSTRKLAQDRKTEADFARQGIRAYKPYVAATKQVTQAQRGLAGAQRAVASAADRQTKAWKDLTPAEKTFGRVLIQLGKTFKAIFTPVMNALLPGVTKGLQTFAKAAQDPRIGKALVATGKALGGAFADFAKTLTAPEMRRAFVDFAAAGVRIIKSFASPVFKDLAVVLTRLAVATMPLLLRFLDRVASWFAGLEKSSRNTKNLRDDVTHLVNVFNDWVTLLGATAKALLDIGRFLEPIGTGIVKFLTHPIESISTALGATKRDVKDFATIFAPVQRAAGAAIGGVLNIFRGMNTVLKGVVRVFAGILTGDFQEAWDGVKTIFRGAIKEIKGIFELATSPFRAIGKHLGTAIINGLIGVINIGIRALNSVLGPRSLGPLGHTPDLRIGEITPIGQHKAGVTIHNRKPAKGLSPAHAPSGRTLASASSVTHQTNNINITTPDGKLPDGRIVGHQIERTLAALA